MPRSDTLIGRCDLKLHRKQAALEVKGLWWEPGVRTIKRLDRAFQAAISDLESFTLEKHQ